MGRRRDWTADGGRANSSSLFMAIAEHVETLIRNSAHHLIAGRADLTAQLIVAQLAHVHGMRPGAAPNPQKAPKGDPR